MINEKQAKKYCKEDISKIKNYDLAIADTTQVWHCHHMTETWWHCTEKELIDNECYYGRKACELIFLTKAEHRRLHNMNMSEETRRKISEANRRRTLSDETRKKMSESLKGRTISDECRRKISEAKKGRKFTEEHRIKLSEAHKGKPSAMKGRTHSEETRKKISAANKGKPSNRKGVTLSEETRRKISAATKRRLASKKESINERY